LQDPLDPQAPLELLPRHHHQHPLALQVSKAAAQQQHHSSTAALLIDPVQDKESGVLLFLTPCNRYHPLLA